MNSLDELIKVSNQTAYRDMDKIQEVSNCLDQLSMKNLLKGSACENYDFVDIYTPLNMTKEDIYNMSFREFAYHLFDSRLDTYWNAYSIDENRVFSCIILYNFFITFNKENILFKQFSMVSLINYLDVMDTSDDQEEPLAIKFENTAVKLQIFMNPNMSIIDTLKKVRVNFNDCSAMDRARAAYQLFRIIFYDTRKEV